MVFASSLQAVMFPFVLVVLNKIITQGLISRTTSPIITRTH